MYIYVRYREATTVTEQHITFNTNLDESALTLERYSLSNALAASVKLDVWEEMVDDYIDSMSYIPVELKVCVSFPHTLYCGATAHTYYYGERDLSCGMLSHWTTRSYIL